MTTLPTTTRPKAPRAPAAPALDARIEALTRLALSIDNGAAAANLAIYGAAMAHPALTSARIVTLVRAVGVGARVGLPEKRRRALFVLLYGPDVTPCTHCVLNTKTSIVDIPPALDCPGHGPAAPKAAR